MIGTAVAQQSLPAVMAFCNALQMTSPEPDVHCTPEMYQDDGTITSESPEQFLGDFMREFH